MFDKDYELIDEYGIFDFKWVKSDDPNSADYSLIESCISVLKNNTQINHVILISGDGDFIELTNQLNKWQVAITLICQQQNYNESIIKGVHYAYSVKIIADNSLNWWSLR